MENVKIEMDVNWDLALGEFLEKLEKYELVMEEFIAVGPGGGNPCIVFSGKKDNLANAFEIDNDDWDVYAVTEM